MTIFTRYDDLPEMVKAPLFELELFIGAMDGKTLAIPTDGNNVIDDGTVDTDDAVKAFNSIVEALRGKSTIIT